MTQISRRMAGAADHGREGRSSIVLQVKTMDTDGYEAVQLAWWTRSDQGEQAGRRPLHEGRHAATRIIREVRVKAGGRCPRPATRSTRRSSPTASAWNVIGTSRGKGFQGVVKRHHRRRPATHGSMFHRAPGSIGASRSPSRSSRACGWRATWATGGCDGAQHEGAARGPENNRCCSRARCRRAQRHRRHPEGRALQGRQGARRSTDPVQGRDGVTARRTHR